jgi:HD-GYP domain-containing protein (c-di-GMP phosphodiesterase class II)
VLVRTASRTLRRQAASLAARTAELGITGRQLDAISHAGLFHDIGKLGVPDAILTKPAALTDEEYAQMKCHPADGADIVAKFGRLRHAVPLIRHHHERWDGRGYPDRLAADAIPLGAAIVGLADAWDAMTTDRPYHRALGPAEAESELRTHRGTQFSPTVVDAFFRVLSSHGHSRAAAPGPGQGRGLQRRPDRRGSPSWAIRSRARARMLRTERHIGSRRTVPSAAR